MFGKDTGLIFNGKRVTWFGLMTLLWIAVVGALCTFRLHHYFGLGIIGGVRSLAGIVGFGLPALVWTLFWLWWFGRPTRR